MRAQLVSSATPCLLVLAASLLACKPGENKDEPEPPAQPVAQDELAERMARSLCEKAFACECELPWVDIDECIASNQNDLQLYLDDASSFGASYDPQCAGELIRDLEQYDCASIEGAEIITSLECPILKGTIPVGGDCSENFGWGNLGDACEPGSVCLFPDCVAIPDELPLPAGYACRSEYLFLPCEDGLLCFYEDDFGNWRCVPPAKVGDPCSNTYFCAGDELLCQDETCVALPAAGEPCFEQSLCNPDAYCDGGKGFVCQPKRKLGEGCATSNVCEAGALCVGNVCSPPTPQICSYAF